MGGSERRRRRGGVALRSRERSRRQSTERQRRETEGCCVVICEFIYLRKLLKPLSSLLHSMALFNPSRHKVERAGGEIQKSSCKSEILVAFSPRSRLPKEPLTAP